MTSTIQHMIQQSLRDRFGLEQLRPLQAMVIDWVLDRQHALVVMPTGSGKSLTYQLPALVERARRVDSGGGTTLVFSPLIALMQDQVSALKRKGISAEFVNSTVGRKERLSRYAKLAKGEYELFYATPERMLKDEFREAISRVPGGVPMVAVDEAHCISKWGHDLRPAYSMVGEFCRLLGDPVIIALTATATRAVRDDIRAVLGVDESAMPLFAAGVDRPNLELSVEPVWSDADKVDQIVRAADRCPGTGIVYFALIKDLEAMLPLVRRALPGCEVGMYHGKLDPRAKKRVYDRFIGAHAEERLVLLATNAFGMGIDKPDIRFIMHAQVPGSVEAYAQEIGRAGRDGEPSRCVLLYDQQDLAIQQQFTEWQNPSADLLVQVMSAIEARYTRDDFDADDLRVDVIGKGHAHGKGGATVEYALIALAKLGFIEQAEIKGEAPRYTFVRPMDDAEIDAEEISEKRDRDLRRLLDVVNLTKSADIPAFLAEYFELTPTPISHT